MSILPNSTATPRRPLEIAFSPSAPGTRSHQVFLLDSTLHQRTGLKEKEAMRQASTPTCASKPRAGSDVKKQGQASNPTRFPEQRTGSKVNKQIPNESPTSSARLSEPRKSVKEHPQLPRKATRRHASSAPTKKKLELSLPTLRRPTSRPIPMMRNSSQKQNRRKKREHQRKETETASCVPTQHIRH